MTRALNISVALLCCLLLFVSSSANAASEYHNLTKSISKKERVAVSAIYDAGSGDVTALGDLWRDRIEQNLRKQGLTMVARQDIGIVIEDSESFGMGPDDQQIWNQSGADIVVTGRYYIQQKTGVFSKDMIELHINAVRISNSEIVGSMRIRESIGSGWQQKAATVRQNVFQSEIKNLTDILTEAGPQLSAKLNKKSACYISGEEAIIQIKTEPRVYLYIFAIAADNTVTLLYPNRFLPNKKLVAGILQFPPRPLRQSNKLRLQLYPLGNQDTSEVIKVIASKQRLDFSFLPIPENQVFVGAKGGDMKKVLLLLKKAHEWNEVRLPYWVGDGCEAQ